MCEEERGKVPSPIRTLVDLAGVLNERALERAVDEAISHRLVRERDLVHALAPNRGRPGIRRLRAIVGDGLAHGVSRSGVERTFRRLIAAAELPMPDFNVRVGRYELDALWRYRHPEAVVATSPVSWHIAAGPGSEPADPRPLLSPQHAQRLARSAQTAALGHHLARSPAAESHSHRRSSA